ncbi:MAG: YbbR-like domain-containing protein, partial [Vicinamibacterales bacterium]
TVEPPTVEVVGPESALKRITEAITEPVSIENQSRPVTEVVTVGVADPGLRLRAAQTATVTVGITAVTEERTVEGVRVTVRNLGEDLRVLPRPAAVSITARGTTDALAGLEPAAIESWVDAAGLAPGEYTLPVHIQAGEGWTVERAEPETVRVRISRR